MSQDSSLSTVTGYRMDGPGFKCWQGHEIFLFTKMWRPALVPTQPPIQWVPGSYFAGVQQIGHKVNSLVQLVIRLRMNVRPQYDFRVRTRETFGYGYDLL